MSMSKRIDPTSLSEDNDWKWIDVMKISSTMKTMEDVPPEVVTIILKFLAMDANLEAMLSYRLVSSQWRDIMDPLIEKRIVSGQVEVFKGGMNIIGQHHCQLNVRTCSNVFEAGRNPFLFNSLLLTGDREAPDFYFDPYHPHTHMSLPVFASTFGGNLTSFALHDQVIPMDTLIAMIGSMPKLKLLNFTNVKLMETIFEDLLPTPPRLPSLSALEVKSGLCYTGRNVLYEYLIASYADQLVLLNLETRCPLPPLQKGHTYSFPANDKTFSIATTSDSAFGQLKQLTMSRPSRDFLHLSETPVLQQLTVTGILLKARLDLWHLLNFVVNCGSTLKKLSLDLSWLELGSYGVRTDDFKTVANQLLATTGVVNPKLKTVTIHYPSKDSQEEILEGLLSMFPALDVLNLLHFQPHDLDREIELEEGEIDVKRADDPVALKKRCAVLRDQLRVLRQNAIVARMRVRGQARAFLRGELDAIAHGKLVARSENLERAVTSATNERKAAFQRLAVLGENREKVIVELLLKRIGVLNTCPHLRFVSASSRGKAVGDVCKMQRTNAD